MSANVLSAWGRGGNKKQKDNMPKKLYLCQCRQVGSSNSPLTQMRNPCCFGVNTTLNETCAGRPVVSETLLRGSKASSCLKATRNQNHLVGSNNQTKEPPRKHRSNRQVRNALGKGRISAVRERYQEVRQQKKATREHTAERKQSKEAFRLKSCLGKE